MQKQRMTMYATWAGLLLLSVVVPSVMLWDRPSTSYATASVVPSTSSHPYSALDEELIAERTTTTLVERANRGSPRTVPSTSTTQVPHRTVTRAPAPAQVPTADFWKRLSMCENPSGNAYGGYFQFTDAGSGRKAGYVPGSSYEAQRAAAIRWAAIIHPGEGTTAGWPTCWWVALRS